MGEEEKQAQLQNWEEVFTLPGAGCREHCVCGKVYFNPNGGWDWEDGELENLERDKNAFSVDYSVGLIEFEGQCYANSCDCWHDRAIKIIDFLEGHRRGIDSFFKLEKARAQAHADAYPELEIYGEGKLNIPEGWKSMPSAPRGAGEIVEVITKRNTVHSVHWAQDLSGEEQLPFSGWFEECGTGYREVLAIGWRPVRLNTAIR